MWSSTPYTDFYDYDNVNDMTKYYFLNIKKASKVSEIEIDIDIEMDVEIKMEN